MMQFCFSGKSLPTVQDLLGDISMAYAGFRYGVEDGLKEMIRWFGRGA